MKQVFAMITTILLSSASVVFSDFSEDSVMSLMFSGFDSASSYIHLYGGAGLHTDGSFSVRMGLGSTLEPQDEDLGEGSVTVFGISYGMWMKDQFRYAGGAVDLSYSGYESDSSDLEFDALSLAVMLMGRVPLFPSEQLPQGRVQPYAGVGPSLVIGDVEATIRYDDGTTAEANEVVWGFGLGVRAGIDVQLTSYIGLFVEYRYLMMRISSDDSDYYELNEDEYSTVAIDMDSGLVLLGMIMNF